MEANTPLEAAKMAQECYHSCSHVPWLYNPSRKRKQTWPQ